MRTIWISSFLIVLLEASSLQAQVNVTGDSGFVNLQTTQGTPVDSAANSLHAPDGNSATIHGHAGFIQLAMAIDTVNHTLYTFHTQANVLVYGTQSAGDSSALINFVQTDAFLHPTQISQDFRAGSGVTHLILPDTEYTFMVISMPVGGGTYRLDAVEVVQRFFGSAVEKAQTFGRSSLTAFPNPISAGATTTLRINVEHPGDYQIVISDLLGRAERNLVVRTNATGEHSLEVTGLCPGTHFVRIEQSFDRRIDIRSSLIPSLKLIVK
jgi:hypothetical protein